MNTYLVTTWWEYGLLGEPKNLANPKSPIFNTPCSLISKLFGFMSLKKYLQPGYFIIIKFTLKSLSSKSPITLPSYTVIHIYFLYQIQDEQVIWQPCYCKNPTIRKCTQLVGSFCIWKLCRQMHYNKANCGVIVYQIKTDLATCHLATKLKFNYYTAMFIKQWQKIYMKMKTEPHMWHVWLIRKKTATFHKTPIEFVILLIIIIIMIMKCLVELHEWS